MIDKFQEAVHDNETETLFHKTSGLNNAKNHVLTHKRLNTCLVIIFSDLNKAQIYKRPYRDSPHHEIEIHMNSNFFNQIKPKEHTRRTNDINFLSKLKKTI